MKREFVLSAIFTISFLTFGFLLLHYDLVGYGISFFVFLPFILGYLLGNAKVKSASFTGLVFSFICFCFGLVVGELEGMVCILMALPIIGFFVAIGYVLKGILNAIFPSKKSGTNNDDILDDNQLKSTILPFLIFATIGIVEKQFLLNADEVVAVDSAIVLPYSPLQVYNAIKSVDTLDAEKPFLMQLDLPIPQKCILEEEKVGGIRTCYFEGGTIVEKVTELEKGKILRMDVIDYQLTGRTWLGFQEAIYTFEALPNGHCKMIRTTTYTSHLYPRAYWKPLEQMGIEQEHQYVFRNLEKDLAKIHQ